MIDDQLKKDKFQKGFKKIFSKEWNYGQINVRSINFGSLKFTSYYDRKNILRRYLLSAIIGAIIGVFSFFFLQNAGIYNLGIFGLFQGISRLVFFEMTFSGYSQYQTKIVFNLLFWSLNLFFNIPFAFFGYFKVGKQFAIISIINIISGTITGLIISSIPQLNNFFIFGDPLTFNQELRAANIQILLWHNVQKLSSGEFVNDSSRVVIILIYGLATGFFTSFPAALIFILGGCRGGLDWYLFYYSKKTMKFFGVVTMYINLVITFVSFILGSFIPYAIFVNHSPDWTGRRVVDVQNLFSPVLLATLLSAFIRKQVTQKFYPQYDVVSLKIYTDKIEEIREVFLAEKLAHAFTINRSIGGYSLKSHPNIEIVCFYKEVPKITEMVRKYDEHCLIITNRVISIQGNFRVQSDLD
ncbi:uncharacterized membrane-anchored protein YitT (DUF2179 family) [Mycoplasmoides fastidiosum]|uniref:Uncharacterized membrane-anchored protein YitT (DUF2179 family) n=1 Tax=Mycoplasmoides fastidiosum TaxID=92758 RepID=A0ABU0LYF8_9BACT|nr:DUF2179 domain-containing protein [Mycoplasmoides fastidiosum]MDQ0513725.1 uncharacterized membrane-anchored protein YitT (DUF2179 family) [Mycoplasmoides fastidiosum]UUD37853.1 DUF2179 domain-containing protein [Mycoplasmoides fastidiosum]